MCPDALKTPSNSPRSRLRTRFSSPQIPCSREIKPPESEGPEWRTLLARLLRTITTRLIAPIRCRPNADRAGVRTFFFTSAACRSYIDDRMNASAAVDTVFGIRDLMITVLPKSAPQECASECEGSTGCEQRTRCQGGGTQCGCCTGGTEKSQCDCSAACTGECSIRVSPCDPMQSYRQAQSEGDEVHELALLRAQLRRALVSS